MKKTIAFVTSGLQFNGNTIYEKALGGSESAMIYMAKEIAKLGNEVTVYCECDKPGFYESVEYRTLQQYFADEKAQFDLLIVSRFTDFLALPIDTKMNILWCHDVDCGNFKDAIGVSDRVFCLSDYHKSLYVENYNITPSNYIWKTSNGYDQTIPTKEVSFEEKKNNYIYASRPERGLKFLLEKIWPEIVEKNPDAVLHICGYTNDFNIPDHAKQLYAEIDDILEYSSGVKKIGHLAKTEYYDLLSRCAYMVYPSDFPEISCINAIEAQYNKCLVITSDKYALSETVKTDTKITAEYGTQKYVNEFLALLDKYQSDVYEEEVIKGQQAITKQYSWEKVAQSWNREIDSMFEKRYEKYKDKIVDQLVYNSDIVAAWKLTRDQKYRDILDHAEKDNLTISDFTPIVKDEDAYLSGRGLKIIELISDIVDKDPDVKLNILDLGSNDGILSLPLMKRFSKNIESLTMYDSSKACLDWVKSQYKDKYPQIKYIIDDVGNVLNYDLKPDIVLVGELLEHIENTQEFLNFLMKIANKDTLFYFTVPQGPWENMVKRDKIEYHHVHHFELNDLKQIFKNVDLTIGKNSHNAQGRRGEICSNWMFWFKASKNDVIEFGEIDYQDKWLKTRPYKKISTCMIVKNEEDNLSRCLKTVTDFSDEIVIVDTGSTDDTKRIAHKFTDKVYDLKWEEEDGLGNFARARNYSIDQATGDYIFWIDADEQLENGIQAFKFLQSDYYDGLLLRQTQCQSKKSHASGVNVDVMHDRIFKRGKIRFTGVVHEYPSKNDHDFLGDKMFWQDYTYILHYGLAYTGTLKRKSLERNSQLIYKNVRVYPNKIFAKHYILVDYWSQFVTDHPKPNMEWLNKALEYWHTVLKPCGDDWTIRLSIGVIQHFYNYCFQNNIELNSKLPEKKAFQNNANGKLVEFFVIDEEETELFFKYLSAYDRTPD
jgi:glycosyltransferase involved in cell wall biosynthesis/2-polyprenyl-3-methyl-5-hydroxy-6-metoxy-1,4-benzoquinol methylase